MLLDHTWNRTHRVSSVPLLACFFLLHVNSRSSPSADARCPWKRKRKRAAAFVSELEGWVDLPEGLLHSNVVRLGSFHDLRAFASTAPLGVLTSPLIHPNRRFYHLSSSNLMSLCVLLVLANLATASCLNVHAMLLIWPFRFPRLLVLVTENPHRVV
jgi:hypothetical protein